MGPLAVITQGGAPDAGLGPGALTIGSECVTVLGDRGSEGVTLVWPSGQTSWRPLERQIVFEHPIEGTTTLSDGDRVVFGGMGLGGDTPEAAAQVAAWLEKVWVQRLDPSCPTALWWVGEVSRVPRVELVNPDGTARGGGRKLTAAQRIVRDRADYAGAYLDNGRYRLPVFLFTGDLDTAVEQLRGPFGDDVRFEVREVERSLAELRAIQRTIDAASDALERQGVTIVEVGVDVPSNQVSVGVLGRVDRASHLLSDYVDAHTFRVEKTGRPREG